MKAAKTPANVKSDEANLDQLELAKSQGKAYVKALRHMVELVADGGDEKAVDDYNVAHAIESPKACTIMRGTAIIGRSPRGTGTEDPPVSSQNKQWN